MKQQPRSKRYSVVTVKQKLPDGTVVVTDTQSRYNPQQMKKIVGRYQRMENVPAMLPDMDTRSGRRNMTSAAIIKMAPQAQSNRKVATSGGCRGAERSERSESGAPLRKDRAALRHDINRKFTFSAYGVKRSWLS